MVETLFISKSVLQLIQRNFTFINSDKKIIYLTLDRKVYESSRMKFSPLTGKTCIVAEKDSETWFFKDTDGNKYELLFQLNELHAARAIQECSNNLSRVGLMESEWQRRCAMD